MTSALIGACPQRRAFWGWQDANGSSKPYHPRDRDRLIRFIQDKAYLTALFKFLKAFKSEQNYICLWNSRGRISANETEQWDGGFPVTEDAHTQIKRTLGEDVIEGITHTGWDVGMIASEILHKSKILTADDIEVSRGRGWKRTLVPWQKGTGLGEGRAQSVGLAFLSWASNYQTPSSYSKEWMKDLKA